MKPDPAEIRREMNEAIDVAMKSENLARVSYAEGVLAALAWVLGAEPEPPMQDVA